MSTDDFEDDNRHNEHDADMGADMSDITAPERDLDDPDGDGFNEFDSPPANTSAGGSLGEVWRNNPIVKIAVVVVGLFAVVAGLIMFGGREEAPRSKVGTAVDLREAPGNETSEAYREAINEVNQQRLEEAMRTGESTMPIPVASENMRDPKPVDEEPPVELQDPLEGWRTGNQATEPEPALDPDPLPYRQDPAQQQVVPMGPDPAAIDALAQAMTGQMQSILDKHAIQGSQIIQVTSREFRSTLGGGSEGGVDDEPIAPTEIREILIPAGTIVYAQTLTEANTDAPGPVLARLTSGPLAGARVLGTFNDTEQYLTLDFNTIVVDGVSQSTNAVALDPRTTLPAVATEVDRRYWRRVILPAAARFIEGMGDAIAQREQTVVVSDGGTTTSSTPDLNTRQELAAGLAAGTSELADELDAEADRTQILIKVHAGTPIGILFMEPVLDEAD